MSHFIIKIEGTAGGEMFEDDVYLLDFSWDPEPFGTITGTPWPSEAKRFPTSIEALDFWKQAKGVRMDGKPNRPLTAFTVSIEKYDEGVGI